MKLKSRALGLGLLTILFSGLASMAQSVVALTIPSSADGKSDVSALRVESDGARRLVETAIATMVGLTNFSVAVDIDSIHGRSGSSSVRAKESWSLERHGGTNFLVRNRFVPVRGREIIESTALTGGNLRTGDAVVPLARDVSLPGFETLSLLREMAAGRLEVVDPGADAAGESGRRWVIVRSECAGDADTGGQKKEHVTLTAWFRPGWALPGRVEKEVGGVRALVTSRDEWTPPAALPASEALNFYENGAVSTTVLRSFHNFRLNPPRENRAGNLIHTATP